MSPSWRGVSSIAQYSEACAMVKQDGALWAWGDLLGAASWKEPVYLADQVLSAPCEAYPGGLYRPLGDQGQQKERRDEPAGPC